MGVENLILQDSPYHTLYLDGVEDVEIRHISIINRRTYNDGHGLIDLSAFNTDGIDVSGSRIWVHDVDIWTQDDCIAVKDDHFGDLSSDMVFERVNASGLGFVVGSIHSTHVRNITFRNSYLHQPVKGIYMKFAIPFFEQPGGLVEDIHYENITMESPSQWPIWIGPAQQSDARNPCHPGPCSLCWPMLPTSQCHMTDKSSFRNLVLRNIQINNPKISTGVILAADSNQMTNVLFEDVRVTQGKPVPYATYNLNETFPGRRQPINDPFVRINSYKNGEAVDSALTLEDDLNRILARSFDSPEEYFQEPLHTVWVGWLSLGMLLLVTIISTLYYFLQKAPMYDNTLKLDRRIHEPLISSSSKKALHQQLYRHPSLEPKKKWFGIVLILLVLVLMFQQPKPGLPSWPFRKKEWQKTDRYFRCEGVFNGIANGSTWPVPECFEKL